ncbi:MAG: Coenzyme F420 hydrogenase/dehydrogenase, beta subunit C-terminal domain [Candidatus Tenebribacter mawsonii]|nr:Coenzyme F420 hydrogenase/dehydrogenase, beta subunit C-terminal domain [Candidatus Tenebribacter mawsonii]
MLSKKILSFDNLIAEVVDQNLCNRCEGCVSFCSANGISALKIGKDGYPEYLDKDKCMEGGICYLICPKTIELEEEISEKYNWKYPLGQWQDIFSARSTDSVIREAATDGGIVTSLLLYMLENNVIDGAIVSRRTENCGRIPMIAKNRAELLEATGSFWSEATHLDELGNVYSSCFPVIKVIKESAEKDMKRLALVGTPCQIKAIRKMQAMNIVPSHLIVFTIGLFCMQCFTLDDLVKQEFAKKHNLKIEDVGKVNIKDKLILHMKSGLKIHIPLEEVEQIAHDACLACSDFANDYADISAGGLGSEDGYTSIIVRNSIGKQIYSEALYKGYVENSGVSIITKKDRDYKLIDIIRDFAIKKRIRYEQHQHIVTDK